ncbi:MAG: hypothetical protein M1816_000188 [Peltula sp. TS41687]|nr:MAG: hypothetical protein M1816_000188 [Peltula sp. TS41687]
MQRPENFFFSDAKSSPAGDAPHTKLADTVEKPSLENGQGYSFVETYPLLRGFPLLENGVARFAQ